MTRINAKRFSVEWCDLLPVTPEGDADMDRAHYAVQPFPSFEAATKFAKSLLAGNEDAFGVVSIDFEEFLLDEDIWENEHRCVGKWVSSKTWRLDDPTDEPYLD